MRWTPRIKFKKGFGILPFVTANTYNGRITSYSVKLGRFRWNSATRVLGWDHPGPGTTDLISDIGPRIGPQRERGKR